jgi:5-methylcytosine-specific restriction protein A
MVGDRIFLSRIGQINPGIFGSGFIHSPPRQEPNFEHPDKLSWYVDVRFDYLSETPDTIVVDHETLAELLNVPKRSFTPQQSGVSFKGDSELLEKIWQSFTGTFNYAEEITDDGDQEFSEGTKQRITVNRYERDPRARAECIRIHGHACKVCGFDFEKVYGELGLGYIHVHHLVPLKDIRDDYTVDPAKDMIPVCPNCHAMLHKLDDPGDVGMLKEILSKKQKRK